jgi:hypothetical protein
MHLISYGKKTQFNSAQSKRNFWKGKIAKTNLFCFVILFSELNVQTRRNWLRKRESNFKTLFFLSPK